MLTILFYVLLFAIVSTIVTIVTERQKINGWKASGNPANFFKVAQHYDKKGSYKDAMLWYEKAAEGGIVEALYELSLCYDLPKGCEKDSEKAFRLCLGAAKQGLEKAQYRVACGYENGLGTDKDLDQAIYWFEQASNNGNKIAANKLERLRAQRS